MTYIPVRTFSAEVGQESTGNAGPDALEHDFDKINKMFDPDAVHDDGQAGGIGIGNIQPTLLAMFTSVPAGIITLFCGQKAPDGWLECNGAAVSRVTYADLFGLYGTTFGSGDGKTTFNLPDLRGEFIRGWDHGRGVDSGRTFGSRQGYELQSHKHLQGSGVEMPLNGYSGTTSWRNTSSTNGTPYIPYTFETGGNETRPRNVALMYIIKS